MSPGSTIHLLVRGRVQGVGFRWFVREEARRLGLSGWVFNRPDGGVELAAAGPVAALDALREAVANGPSAAQVTAVDPLPISDVGELPHPFGVRR